MRNESDLEQSLKRLKPSAEKTLLKDVKMSSQLEERILEEIQVKGDAGKKPIRHKGYLWTIVAFAIAVATTFTAFGLLHSSKTTRQTIAAIEVSVISVTPAAGLSTFLIKENLRLGDYRLHALPSPYSVT